MTDITVKLDPETGAATIELRGATVAEPRFRLRDTATEKFLTRRGWSKTPSYLPGEAVTAADFTVLVIDAELARRVTPGMSLTLEQPTSNIFANLDWPAGAAAAEDEPEEEKSEPEDAETTPDAEEEADLSAPETTATGEPDDEMLRAGDETAKSALEDGKDAEIAAPPAAVDADESETVNEPSSAADEPVSLEPTIRDEAITPYRIDPVPVAAKPAARTASIDDDDDDEEEGRPWGKLAAAALAFMVLGAVLTYFWQSSAYENELRTAMRAVEAQRDQVKADLEKRLADAEADAGKVTSDSVTAANARVASLTDQTSALAKDRDEARSALSEQRAAVQTLEERLATAQAEIASLKAAAEADATEQTAVFNTRIESLGKDLDAARTELEKNRAQLSDRDQAIEKAGEELGKANEEIAALRKAAEDRQVAQDDEAESRINALSAQLDKAVQDLATRDQTLRDVQAKLSVANVQIEALKQVAGKATEADLERGTLADRISELTGQIDKADKDLAARENELRKAKADLDAANARLAANAGEMEKLKATASAAPEGDPQDAAAMARLKEERDLYAKELSTMTESLKALKAERDRLAEAAGNAEQQPASLDTGDRVSGSRSVWGATAIDQSGAIYSLQNQIAEKSATDNVVALCRGKSNGRCEPLRTYSNSCFSLARIDGEGPRNDNFGFAVDKNWKTAESSAIRQCEELGANCTVRFTACSPDALSKPSVNQ